MIIMLTGLSGAGKSTLARCVYTLLNESGVKTQIIDGDEYRKHVCKDLGFSKEDRMENIRRLGCIANQFSAPGNVVFISAINPYKESRDQIRNSYADVQLVFIDCPIDTLIVRDTKGLYKRSLLKDGHPDKVVNLTGVNDNYDTPVNPDLYINTGKNDLVECTNKLTDFIFDHINLVTSRHLIQDAVN